MKTPIPAAEIFESKYDMPVSAIDTSQKIQMTASHAVSPDVLLNKQRY